MNQNICEKSNDIIEECKTFLLNISNNKYTFDNHINNLKNTIQKKLIFDENRSVILLGKSLFAPYIEKVLVNKYKLQTSYWDDFSNLFEEKNAIPIITTAKYCKNYAQLLENSANQNYLNYNQLFLIDDAFNIEGNPFRNQNNTINKIKDIFEHAIEYYEFFEKLCDDKSKILLAHLLMYRLTLNTFYTLNIPQSDSQYFDSNLIHISEETCFVDAGGYNGDTLKEFLKVSNKKFKKYYFFEPVDSLRNQAKDKYKDDRIEFIPYCLWNKDMLVSFEESQYDMTQCHTIEYEDNNFKKVPAKALDSVLEKESVTFIKMDIEGAEMRALQGAVHIIKKSHPILTISAYHEADDLLNISKFISDIGGYKLYLRTAENNLDYDFILYAI